MKVRKSYPRWNTTEYKDQFKAGHIERVTALKERNHMICLPCKRILKTFFRHGISEWRAPGQAENENSRDYWDRLSARHVKCKSHQDNTVLWKLEGSPKGLPNPDELKEARR